MAFTVELAFGGWGEPPLPMDVSEIKDWYKGLEDDHQKVPDWLFPFVDILMEQKDTCEVSTGRYRKSDLKCTKQFS